MQLRQQRIAQRAAGPRESRPASNDSHRVAGVLQPLTGAPLPLRSTTHEALEQSGSMWHVCMHLLGPHWSARAIAMAAVTPDIVDERFPKRTQEMTRFVEVAVRQRVQPFKR